MLNIFSLNEYLSERKMSTLNFKVSTLEYADIFIKRTRINGLIAWFEPCEYAEYAEIDQNSEKIKNRKSYRIVTPVTFKDFFL